LRLVPVDNVSPPDQTFFLATPVSLHLPKIGETQMSGVETVKVIVEAEKEAAKILADAQTRAGEIRKRLDSLIEKQRDETIEAARKKATALVADAKSEAGIEGQAFEKDAKSKMREMLERASGRRGEAVEKLVSILVESAA